MNALARRETQPLPRRTRELVRARAVGPATRVLVADRSRLAAEALMFTLESDPSLEPIGYAVDVWEALELTAMFQPDAVVLGPELARLDSTAFTRLARKLWPEILIVVLAQAATPADVEDAYGAGADGFLAGDRSADELLDAVGGARAPDHEAALWAWCDGPEKAAGDA